MANRGPKPWSPYGKYAQQFKVNLPPWVVERIRRQAASHKRSQSKEVHLALDLSAAIDDLVAAHTRGDRASQHEAEERVVRARAAIVDRPITPGVLPGLTEPTEGEQVLC